MTEKYKLWYSSLSNPKQLLVSFSGNVAFWFILSLLFNLLLWKQDKPGSYFAFKAIFMGFLFTVLFNWPKIKAIFWK